MIAMRYGTLPIVRETGGLKDTVKPYNKFTGEGNGFSFANYNAHEMKATVEMACEVYRSQPEAWAQLQRNAMSEDFSFFALGRGLRASLYRHAVRRCLWGEKRKTTVYFGGTAHELWTERGLEVHLLRPHRRRRRGRGRLAARRGA